MGSGVKQVDSGKFIGTGASLDVALNFTPRMVEIWSATENAVNFKNEQMVGVEFLQLDANAGTVAKVTSNGITLGTRKFTVGTDAKINTSASEYYWKAFE